MPALTVRVLLAAVVVLALLAPAASADSIVYLGKDGNVWLTSPDGARGYRVTDGGGWDSPSQADDGTIVAIHGTALVRMDRRGRVIGTPVPGLGGDTSTLIGDAPKLWGPFDAAVSPDGRRIAYSVTAYDPWSTSDTTYTDFRDAVVVTASDHLDVQDASWITSVNEPAWLTNDRLLVHGSGFGAMDFQTWVPGIAPKYDYNQWWFQYVNAIENDPELSPDGTKLVSVAQTNGATSAQDTLHFFSVPGAAWTPPPYPDTYRSWDDSVPRPPAGQIHCQNVRDSEAHSPSWSPDSKAIAYDDRDGVWVERVGDVATTCEGMDERLLIAGGRHPDWGPADVDPSDAPGGPAPQPGPTGRPGPAAHLTLARLRVVGRPKRGRSLRVAVVASGKGAVVVRLCPRGRGRCAAVTARVRAGRNLLTVPARRVRGLRPGRCVLSVAARGGTTATTRLRLR